MHYTHPKQHAFTDQAYELPYSSGPDELNLAIVENHVQCGPAVACATRDEHNHMVDLAHYPGNRKAPARTALSAAIRRVENIPSDLDIVFTHGSDSALRAILASFADYATPARVMYLAPTYPHFLTFLNQSAGTLRGEPLAVGIDDDHVHILRRRLEQDARPPHMVYLVSPSLPFGHVVKRSELKELTDAYPNVLFVVDEAYAQYQSPEKRIETAIGLGRNVLVTRTFSKAYALASVRLGWVIGPPAVLTVINAFINQKDVTDYACRLATAALNDHKYYMECARTVMTRSRQIFDGVDGLHMGDGGNFALLRMQAGDPPVAEFVSKLQEQGFLTRNKHTEIPFSLRFTIPPPDMALGLRDAIDRVRKLNQQLPERREPSE